MAENNTIALREEIARTVSSEAIESLLTVYWADSFNSMALESGLLDLILSSTLEAKFVSGSMDPGSDVAIAPNSPEPSDSPNSSHLDPTEMKVGSGLSQGGLSQG